MPWLRVVFKLGKLRLMKSHEGALFLHWNGRQVLHLPPVRLPKLRRKHQQRSG